MDYQIEVDSLELSLISLGLQHLTIAIEMAAKRGQPASESMLTQLTTMRARIAAQADGCEAGAKANWRPNPHPIGTDLWRCWQRAYDRTAKQQADQTEKPSP